MAVSDIVQTEGALATWIANSSVLTAFIIILHQFFIVQPFSQAAWLPTNARVYLIALFAFISILFCILAIYPYVVRVLYFVSPEGTDKPEDEGVAPLMERVHLILLLIVAIMFLIAQITVAYMVVYDAFKRAA